MSLSLRKMARLSALAVVALAATAMLAPMAQATTPNPGYSQFAGCPDPATENPTVVNCFHNTVKSGKFKMGNKDVPIEKPIHLIGGVNTEGENFVFNSKGGLLPAKQKVPGGVIGLTGLTWLLEFFGSEALTLYATTELAGQPKIGNPELVQLPVKVHLEHSVLGNKCYVGSNSNPIQLKLAFTGAEGFEFDPVTEIFKFVGVNYQDKTFSAPGANGCTLTLFGFIPISINGLVNTQSGLPAATGNETIQITDIETATAENVY